MPLRGFFYRSMSWNQKNGLWELQFPKPRLHRDFREEVITGGSVTMKLFVQRPLRVYKFIGKMKKYFKNRLNLRLYVQITMYFMLYKCPIFSL